MDTFYFTLLFPHPLDSEQLPDLLALLYHGHVRHTAKNHIAAVVQVFLQMFNMRGLFPADIIRINDEYIRDSVLCFPAPFLQGNVAFHILLCVGSPCFYSSLHFVSSYIYDQIPRLFR